MGLPRGLPAGLFFRPVGASSRPARLFLRFGAVSASALDSLDGDSDGRIPALRSRRSTASRKAGSPSSASSASISVQAAVPAAARQPFGPHPVDADLGEQGALRVEQVVDVAGGDQPDDGDEGAVADPGAQQPREGAGQGVGEGFPQLVPDAGGDRELEVPAERRYRRYGGAG